MTFVKGQSGNPSGLPARYKKASNDMRDKCMDIALGALHIMKDIIYDINERGSTRVSAWNSVADRGLGKAIMSAQPEQSQDEIPATEMTSAQIKMAIQGDIFGVIRLLHKEGKLEAILNEDKSEIKAAEQNNENKGAHETSDNSSGEIKKIEIAPSGVSSVPVRRPKNKNNPSNDTNADK